MCFYDFICYLSGITDEQLQQDRDEVLRADVAAIRELAPYVEAILSKQCVAALGDEEVIEKEAELFKEVKSLI